MKTAVEIYPYGGALGVRTLPTVKSYVPVYIANRRTTGQSVAAARSVLGIFCAAVGNPRPENLTTFDVEVWWAGRQHLRPSSQRNQYATVRCFLGWLRAHGLIDTDPLAVIARPRPHRRVPVTLTPNEIRALRGACETNRDRVIVELGWGVGLRCVEIAQLEVPDVDFDRALILVRGKGDHHDLLPLPCSVATALGTYLTERPATEGPVVRSERRPSEGLTANWVSHVVADLATTAGVKRARYDGRGAHSLRRTLATDLLEGGESIRKVQRVMRHRSLTSTEAYLRIPEVEELRGPLERRREAV